MEQMSRRIVRERERERTLDKRWSFEAEVDEAEKVLSRD
jgi:hypothetical protein